MTVTPDSSGKKKKDKKDKSGGKLCAKVTIIFEIQPMHFVSDD